MFLQGTGKPLNNYCNKTWTVSRHKTVCKSAPTVRQHQSKDSNTDSWNNAKQMKIIAPRKSLTCADLSKLLETHSIARPKSTLPTTAVDHFYENIQNSEKSVVSPRVGDRVEYEQIFKNVFDFYEQNTDTRSHVYINT